MKPPATSAPVKPRATVEPAKPPSGSTRRCCVLPAGTTSPWLADDTAAPGRVSQRLPRTRCTDMARGALPRKRLPGPIATQRAASLKRICCPFSSESGSSPRA
jgi:hypothetical protein